MSDAGEPSTVGAPADQETSPEDGSPSVRDRVLSRFAVDTRALAVVRVGLGLIVLADLVHRARDLTYFYTDAGVYPRAAYALNRYDGLSLHGLSGDAWFQALLFVVAGLFALAFVVGYRTRVTGVASLILLLSLHARNPAVLNGGDLLLRALLFVSLVTPLGERWSIDALRRGQARETVTSFGTAALLVQPVAVFTTNVVEKSRGETWFAGDALQTAMNNEVMTLHLGEVLAGNPALLTVLNYAWVTLLAGSALFLLVPTGRLRSLSALAYVGAFAGMLATMSVGWFPLVLTVAVVPYLTSPFWDALEGWVPSVPTPPSLAGREADGSNTDPGGSRRLQRPQAPGDDGPGSFVGAFREVGSSVLGALVLVWIVTFSAAGAAEVAVPERLDRAFLDTQEWDLYAPDPTDTYGWYVPEAESANGETFHALTGDPVGFDPPPEVSQAYDSFRERKFMESVRASGRDDPGLLAKSYADWACRQAREHTDGTVRNVTVHRLFLKIQPDGGTDGPRSYVLLDHACPSDPTA